MGTGDGRAVLERARREPRSLVIGLDANAAAMAEVSRRAAASPSRGGAPNAVFGVAAVEQPPRELIGRADEVSVLFPWGSLLRGALALDDAAAGGLASLVRQTGRVIVTTSITERDQLDLPSLDDPAERRRLAERWRAFGLEVAEIRCATMDEVAATRSTWARRLGAGRSRPVWRFELHATAWLTTQRTDLKTAGRIAGR